MRLSDAQVHALAMLANGPIEMNLHYFYGTKERTLRVLAHHNHGLVTTIGTRKVKWTLTPEGKAKVKELMKEGRIEREEKADAKA